MNKLAPTYDPKAVEDKWYQYWEQHELFKSTPDEREPYTIAKALQKAFLTADDSHAFLHRFRQHVPHVQDREGALRVPFPLQQRSFPLQIASEIRMPPLAFSCGNFP